METAKNRRWLNSKEAAEYLGLTLSALYGLVHRKRIPCYRWGSRLRFYRAELDDLLLKLPHTGPADSYVGRLIKDIE